MASILVSFIFIILGIAIKNGKMYNLIAGYNTMTKEQQKKYNIEGIAVVFRNGLFAIAILNCIGYLISLWLNNPQIEFYTIIFSVLIGVTYILVLSNSSKYKIKKQN